jgi:ribosomal protein S18 acetylase RimI-like enzyme
VSSTYTLRPRSNIDLPAIAGLFAARERELYGRAFTIEEDLKGPRPRFEPEADSWVVMLPDDSVIAYGEVWEREPGRLMEAQSVVSTDHIGQGLEALLIDITEGRARERAAGADAKLRHVTHADDRSMTDLLEGSGHERVRRFQHMAIDLAVTEPPLPAADGIILREFDPGRDTATVHAILQDAFAGTWEFVPTPLERWRTSWVETPNFDASLWFVAEAGQEPVGVILGMTRPQGGWIIDLGVVPSRRGRGIGAALMRRAFESFRDHGVTIVELNVDTENPTGAVRLYEHLGMTVTRSWDLYDKVLI